MHPETLAIHAGRKSDQATGAVTAPIHLSTTFERAADGSFPSGFEYSRDDNPNRRMLETCLAALEGGEEAIVFSSGMAAITAVIESLPPEHPRRLLLPDDMYFGIRSLLNETDLGARFDRAVVDMTDLDAVEAACAAPTGIVWIETPSNPLLKIVDISTVADIAHRAGAVVVVDNTWATPLLQRPFELGADLIVHALTKYIGGHSDLMIGGVVARHAGRHGAALRAAQKHKGAIPSPFECWLALRGMQSLAPRMNAHCSNAMAIAKFLSGHPAVSAVHYPGLPDHPGFGIASEQMTAFGGMLSFEVKGGRAEAMKVAASLKLITRATSLGGTHSLIEHRASVEGPETRAPENLLRLSVGLEHAQDLVADLQEALECIPRPS
ncbi:aminotransferase class I/II-fold pyridoxal phosphate-dependent enzyme [Phenylobacterium sp. LjRoot225]|uniref:trans-sulfuration enzyme family protein n=1 Tax=Phenylobacterium sp. LjRoot225 TaxID=3342285 RepID=UPI003ED0D342